MNTYKETIHKLQATLIILKESENYETSIRTIMQSLDEGLQFTKEHYSELLSNDNNGSDIYFFFMRFSHQFFNVMNLINVKPNASYYQRTLHLFETRQKKFVELREEAIIKASRLLGL